jgi:hypothetical protein
MNPRNCAVFSFFVYFALSVSAFAAETVRFKFVSPTLLGVGENFQVHLHIDPASQGISEVPFIIGYDPAVIEVQSVKPGGFLAKGSLFKPSIDNVEGRIRVDVAPHTHGEKPQSDVLATVYLRVARRFASTSIVGLTMAPVDTEGNGLPVDYPATLHIRNRPR